MLEPVPASTVVICRITKEWPHKILLQKRSERAAFLPGAYVFPGGRVEEKDAAFGSVLSLDEKSIARCAPFFIDSPLPFLAAAIRETLEETGIALVRAMSSTKPLSANILHTIINNADGSTAISIDRLWPISWWITPAGETRRFDTRFFLAMVDDDDGLDTFDGSDTDGIADYRWLTPEDALRQYHDKEIFMAPPTRSIVERMATTASLEDFLRYVDKPLRAIRPHFIADEGGQKFLVLPGDRAHAEQDKPLMLMHTRYQFP